MRDKFEFTVLDMIESAARSFKTTPLNLGGLSGAGGGVGTPPGGYIGQLPQTRVAYDETEAATLDTPASGMSLLDNLNHIRYRLGVVESGSVPGTITIIDDNEILTYDDVTIIHFSGGVSIVELNPGEVQVIVTASGGSGFGATEHIVNEVPSGVMDGANDTYYTEYEYSPTTLAVYLNGQRLKESGEDYTEITQGFTMTVPPESTDILLVDYLRTVSEAGNADTVDGYHASSFSQTDHNHDVRYIRISGDSLIPEREDPTSLLVAGYWQMYIKVDGLYLRDDTGVIIGPMVSVHGWHPVDETWTRTGDHSFTISGDFTTVYRKGTKIRYKDGGSYEYGVVGAVSHAAGTTTVTLITNTDFAMAATTITDRYVSYIETPESWPDWFGYTPSYSAGGSMTYTSVTTSIAKWRSMGANTIFVKVRASGTTGGTASNTISASVPVDALDAASFPTAFGQVNDGGPIAARIALRNSTPDLVDAVRYDNANFGLGTGRIMNVGVIYEF